MPLRTPTHRATWENRIVTSGSTSGDDAEEPEQQELAPLDGAERLARVEQLRETLEETGEPAPPEE